MNWKERRADLLKQLGGKCAKCGRTKDLQFDHKKSRNWKPETMSKEKRLRSYQTAAKAGKIQLLCAGCHAEKTITEGQGFLPRLLTFLTVDAPF